MKKEKVVYLISDIEKALGFEWVARDLTSKVDLSYILIGKEDTAFQRYLAEQKIRVTVISDSSYPSYIKKWFKIYSLLKNNRPDVVHVHLWRAMLLGLSVAWVLRIRKRVTTRHHASLHYDQYPSGRKWDVLCNAMASDIIAISKNIEHILVVKDKADPKKVTRISHGFDLNYFKMVSDKRIETLVRKYDLSTKARPVIGVISRYTEWKGIQFIIPAFKRLLVEFPDAHLVLANASGEYEKVIRALLKEVPERSYTEIKFEEDLAALYHLFDVFVHVPINQQVEAFGQIYIEALTVGIPSVVTLSGIATEFIHDQQNAIVVDYENSDHVFTGIKTILQNNSLRENIIREGRRSVERFSMESHIVQLERLYGIAPDVAD